ncbi:MAG: hypothetical protein M0R51_11810 [Clostridia bacterium]|nr:hypothetical protein [Clostridia bacterium]
MPRPTDEEIIEMQILSFGPLTYAEIGALHGRSGYNVCRYVNGTYKKKETAMRPRKCCIKCNSLSLARCNNRKNYRCGRCGAVFSVFAAKTKMAADGNSHPNYLKIKGGAC